jgi:hypothetical protein
MPSFMEGFANAFGQQMTAGQEQRAAAKRDAFRIAYDSYLNKKSQWDADKKQDQQFVDAAKAAVAAAPGTPDGAWEHAYQWLRAGSSFDNVVKRLGASQFASVETPSMQESMDGDVGPGTNWNTLQNNVNKQTQQSGMAPMDLNSGSAGAPIPSAMDAAKGGNFFGQGGVFDPNAAKQRQMQGVQGDIASQTGNTPEELAQINAGYTPTQPPHVTQVTSFDESAMTGSGKSGAEFDPTKAVVGEIGGKYVDMIDLGDNKFKIIGGGIVTRDQLDNQPMTRETRDNLASLVGQIGTQAETPIKNRANTVSLVNQLHGLDEIAQQNANVLTKANTISVFTNELTNEFASLGDQLGSMMQQPDWAQKQEAIINKVAQDANAKFAFKNANDAQRFASLLTSSAFTVARMNNGTGNLSTQDVKSAFQEILGANDKAIFSDSIKQIANDAIGKTNNEMHQLVALSPQAQMIKKMQGGDQMVQQFFGDAYEALSPEDKAWAKSESPLGSKEAPQNGAPEQVNSDHGSVVTQKPITPEIASAFELDYTKVKGKTIVVFSDGYKEVR